MGTKKRKSRKRVNVLVGIPQTGTITAGKPRVFREKATVAVGIPQAGSIRAGKPRIVKPAGGSRKVALASKKRGKKS